ncbi:MAG: hypothetical protein AAGC60_17975 [Acidobacteriota bacterium]
MITPPAAARLFAARALQRLPPRLAGRLARRPSSRLPIERVLAAARPDLDADARRALAQAAASEAAEARAAQRVLHADDDDEPERAARRLCARISLDGWHHLDGPDEASGRMLVVAPTVWWPTALAALDLWHGPLDLLRPRWTYQGADGSADALTAQRPAVAPPRGDLVQSVDIEFLAERLQAGGRIAALPPPAASASGYDPSPLEPLFEAATACGAPVVPVAARRGAKRRVRLDVSAPVDSLDSLFADLVRDEPTAWAWSAVPDSH